MRSHPVARLLKQALILLLILVMADRAIGAWLEHMFYKQKHGDEIVTRYTLDSTKEDVLIFGSSRASHHYNSVLLDSLLGMSVYNCGRDEMGVTYTAAMVPIIYKRYTPKCIIIDLQPTELSGVGRDVEIQRISTRLIPYANRHPDLWQTVAYAGKIEVYKAAISKIYPYNSLIGAIIQNTYTNLAHATIRGYEPLQGKIDSVHYQPTHWVDIKELRGVDSTLAKRFTSLLDNAAAHGTKVFVVISPFYYPLATEGNESYKALPELSATHGAFFLDWSRDPRFLKHPDLFYDDVHLNDKGARLYSSIIADTLKKLGINGLAK